MRKEFDTLQQMNCWYVVSRPRNKQVMHSKFVLNQKRDENRKIAKHMKCIVVCGDAEGDINEECVSRGLILL